MKTRTQQWKWLERITEKKKKKKKTCYALISLNLEAQLPEKGEISTSCIFIGRKIVSLMGQLRSGKPQLS